MRNPPPLWGYWPIRINRPPRKAEHIDADIVEIMGEGTSPKDINRWANHNITYVPDRGRDYWQTVEETFDKRTGDCEDIAILKQAMLRGINIDSWVVIVKDRLFNRFHAVTVTDNMVFDLAKSAPMPIEAYIDYIPKIAFNDDVSWVWGKPIEEPPDG